MTTLVRRFARDAWRLLNNEGGWVIAGVVVAVVAAAASAYTAYEQGQQQQKIANFNAKVAENSATAQRQAAAVEAENLRDKQRLIMASQRAGIGASGILGSEGTPLLVQTDSAEKAALNEARVRYSGEVNARTQESEAIIQGYIGKQAARQGNIQAGVSLLQGASTAAAGYGKYSSAGNQAI